MKALRAGVYVVATAGGVRNIDASASTGSIALDGSSAGENIVRYEGGSGADTIKGSLASDVLIGNDGNDTITGGLSADTINVGGGANSVVFTSGLTADQISGYTSNDNGSFDLSDLETRGAVELGETLDFVTGSNISVSAGDTIYMQNINGAIVLSATTNVLNYLEAAVANAAALETALEESGGKITTNAALEENDAFIIQYQDSDTNAYQARCSSGR